MQRTPACRYPTDPSPNIGIFHLRHESLALARRLGQALDARIIPLPNPIPSGWIKEELARQFAHFDQWIWIMTTGIAVRYASGWLEDKRSDPGIVVVDEAARFAVSLVGGHEGGANALAYAVARATGATPVITTASEAVRPLVAGVGCRRGISERAVGGAIRQAVRRAGFTLEDLREVATIERKAREPGLVAWCRKQHIPLRIIRTEQIRQRPWYRSESEWVQKTIGIPAVAEPCALIAAPTGELVLERFAWGGVTVALARDAWTRGGTILLPATAPAAR
jgi:cobalt-precorrin 5A hydrolase